MPALSYAKWDTLVTDDEDDEPVAAVRDRRAVVPAEPSKDADGPGPKEVRVTYDPSVKGAPATATPTPDDDRIFSGADGAAAAGLAADLDNLEHWPNDAIRNAEAELRRQLETESPLFLKWMRLKREIFRRSSAAKPTADSKGGRGRNTRKGDRSRGAGGGSPLAPGPGRTSLDPARPSPRFPGWMIAGGGLDVTILDGPEAASEAQRLVADSRVFVWRRSGLCFPVERLGLDNPEAGSHKFQANLCRRTDRKFVYFNAGRFEHGPYDPDALTRDFVPMTLNVEMALDELRRRHKKQPPHDNGKLGRSEESSVSGWAPATFLERGTEIPYLFQIVLETLPPEMAHKFSRLPAKVRPPNGRLRGLPGGGLDDTLAVGRPECPGLLDALVEGVPWARLAPIAQAGAWGGLEQAGLMLSGRDTLTPLHMDRNNVIFMQLRGAKRWFLFGPEQSTNLYPFPAMHPVDPLSRVDFDVDWLTSRWPRTAKARGATVVLEQGDVLVMPQGVWHHVHSLEEENVSMNFNFGLHAGEATGLVDGPKVRIGKLPTSRRAAALWELAKTAEGVMGEAVGPMCASSSLCGAHAAASSPESWPSAAPEPLLKLLHNCLGDGKGGKPVMDPAEYVREYFDPLRFVGLPLRGTGTNPQSK